MFGPFRSLFLSCCDNGFQLTDAKLALVYFNPTHLLLQIGQVLTGEIGGDAITTDDGEVM